MSVRPYARDDSRATPYFVTRNYPPVKTYRTTYFDIARDSLIGRKLGGKDPFWVRGLNAYQRYNKYMRRKIPHYRKRYIPFYPWFANAKKTSKDATSKGNTKFQKNYLSRRRFQSSKYQHQFRSRYRRRFCRCWSNRTNRRPSTYRKYYSRY